MKYPFTPEILDAMPEELAELYRTLELNILKSICSQLKFGDTINQVTLDDIKILRSHGLSLTEIKKAIAETSEISSTKLDQLFSDVVTRNQVYYDELISLTTLTQPESYVSASDIAAIRAQTQSEFQNLTQSLGFIVRSGGVTRKLPLAQSYQWALDNAVLKIQSGSSNYSEAIKDAVKMLADSGVRNVYYASGHVDNIDVAARRAVMTGISQICDKYTVQAAEYIGTAYYEVSAHQGARDVDGPMGWENHKAWQGKVYSVRTQDIYPSIYEVCGLGDVTGLEGANCRHRRFAFVPGVSERTYTDEQLKNIDPPPFEYQGRTYTAYEATQKQRQIERTLRKLNREKQSYEAVGAKDAAAAVGAKSRLLKSYYKDFSKAAGLPEQLDRIKTYRPISSETDISAFDKNQFERYSKVLGDLAPKSLNSFLDTKYGNFEAYEQLKAQYRVVNRYTNDDHVPAEKILELDKIAYEMKRTGFDYSGFTGRDRKDIKSLAKSGNAAVMELDGNTYFSHSQADLPNTLLHQVYKGQYPLVGLSQERRFTTGPISDIDEIPREYDAEAKLLEYAAKLKSPEDKFTLTILSEKHICKSCRGVVRQFKQAFPNATIRIVSGKRGYNNDISGNKTWRFR